MKKYYLLLLFILGINVFGQQKGISYQAVIFNPSNIVAPGYNPTSLPLANKSICLSFQIVNDSNQVEYQESQLITTDIYGMVNVVIGTGTLVPGLVSSIEAVTWNLGNKKLVVAVNIEGMCSNYTEISNQVLNYTPLSFYAQNADLKDGYVTANKLAEGSVTDTKVAMGINPAKVGLENVSNTSDADKPLSTATQTALDLKANGTDVIASLELKENLSNKSTDIATDADSTTKYPTVKAVKKYLDSLTSSNTIVDADATTKGKIQLAGDLAGTAALPTVPGLSLKANTTDVITALNLKANDSDVATALNLKANSAVVTAELALKLDTSQKGVANGVATLNSSGIIPSNQLPPVTISSTSVVGSDAAMTALSSATVGSIAIRTDLNKNYVLSANDPSIIGNWIELLTPAAPVQAVNGYVGSVNLTKTDIDLDNVDNTSDVNKPVSNDTRIALNLKANISYVDEALALKISRTEADAALNLKLDASTVGSVNGVASLNALGKIPTDQIPAISFSSVKVLSNQADMLALSSAVIGSVVIRTDVNKNYVLAQANPSVLANWIELLTPAPPVQSVNGYSGNVSLSKADFDLSNVNNTSDASKPISGLTQTALDSKANSSSLAVVATTGDYRDLLNLPSAVDASSLSGTLAIAKGGTGSTTKNFVDLSTDQSISGAKTFTTNGTYSAALTVSGNLVAPNIGSSSVVDFTHRIVSAATTSTFTKLIQFGTGGLSGSNTIINIGSGVSGANNAITIGGASSALTTSTTVNGTVILPALSAEGVVTNSANGVLNTTSIIPVVNGGTGATTKQTAFDGLSPMTTAGDIIYGGLSGTGTRLSPGTEGQVLKLVSGLPSWQVQTGFDKEVEKVNYGTQTGALNQANFTTALGPYAGQQNQKLNATAIGRNAGNINQGYEGVALGSSAGNLNQGNQAIAIGNAAGGTDQGSKSIAIGELAGATNQDENSIVFNATGVALNTANPSALYIAPIRSASNNNVLLYNTTTKEVTTSADFAGNAANVTGIVAVANGGTGSSTLELNGLLIGNGTNAIQTVSPGNNANVLTSNGTTWSSSPLTINANSLSGTTLASSVVNSSLTSVGTLSNLTTSGKLVVGASTASASSAILEANSTTKGFLPPRMTSLQKSQIASPAKGLMIMCTDCGTQGEMLVYNGINWTNISGVLPITTIGTVTTPIVGAAFQGGKVLYILTATDPGYDYKKVKGIIAASQDLPSAYRLDNGSSNASIANNGTSIGDGLINTNLLMAAFGNTIMHAAKAASDYSVTEGAVIYDDWYLPSNDEMKKLYENKAAIGDGFNAEVGKWYWSSSYYTNSGGGNRMTFISGYLGPESSDKSYFVRPIRYFSIDKNLDVAATTFTGSLVGNASTATLAVSATTAASATTADNITATSNTTLTSLANVNTVGTITSGTWNGTTIAIANGGTDAITAADARTNLGAEALSNKSTAVDLGSTLASDDKYPSQKAVKTYVDAQTAAAGVSDGSITNAKLAGSIAASKLIGTDITTLGTITAGTWNGTTVAVANGGTGSSTLTGYVKGNGTSSLTASATIPAADITGLIKKVNGSLPDANGSVTVPFGSVTTGTLAARPGSAGTNGNIYVVSGDTNTPDNGRTYISDGTNWNEVTSNQAATDARYLQLAGGTLAGSLTIPTAKVLTITDAPSNNTDATNKSYVDAAIANSTITDATSSSAGKIQLAGDLAGVGSSATNPKISSVGGSTAALINSAEVLANAAVSANTANQLVKRDASGNFSAGTITASLTGNVTGNITGNVSGTASNVTGTVGVANGGSGAITLTGYVKGNGTSAFTSSASIPASDITGLIKKVNGSAPDADGNVSVAFGTVTTGTLSGRPVSPGTNGNIYVISGDATTAENGRTFISDGIAWKEVTSNQSATDARYLKLAGGTLAGNIVIPTTNKITLTDAPTVSTDAVNKAYVDASTASASIANATTSTLGKIQLAGDLAGAGTSAASPKISSVGGSTAALINSAEVLANAAVSANTANQLVKRDVNGDFSARTISANLTGTVTGNATNVTGVVAGANGGTGVANTGKTITLGGNFETLHALKFTTAGGTNLILPTSGTLATVQQLDAKELLSNKSIAVDLGSTTPSDDKYPSQKAVKTYVDGKVSLVSPAFTGIPTAPTATSGISTTQIATTAFVAAALSGVSSSIVGYTTALQTNGSNTGNNNVGIGPSTALSTLGFANTSIGASANQSNSNGQYNTAIGFRALSNLSVTGSDHNVAIGHAAGFFRGSGWDYNNQQTYESIYIGSYSRASANNTRNEIVIGYNAIGNGSNTIQLGNTAIANVYTSGNVNAKGVLLTSDYRLKKNIIPIKDGISTIMKLNPVNYDKKNSLDALNYDKKENGFIAQEIQKVIPYIVIEAGDNDKLLSVDYTSIIPVLTKAIQEQQVIIEQLKKSNELYAEQIKKLTGMIEKILEEKRHK